MGRDFSKSENDAYLASFGKAWDAIKSGARTATVDTPFGAVTYKVAA